MAVYYQIKEQICLSTFTIQMNTKPRIGIVNYWNTKPLLMGLQRMQEAQEIELLLDYPSAVANALLQNTIDIGLVPIAILPLMPHGKIVSKYCISSAQEVASVCLFSKVPIDAIDKVILDYQSRTSVQLVQILFKHYWKKNVAYVPANENYISEIKDTTAGVIIGDRALQNLDNYPYVYDLVTAWRALTNLPFVFAAWIANSEPEADFIENFEKANAIGLEHIDEIVAKENNAIYDLKKYYTYNIQYTLDAEKRASIELFLQYISDL